jgi:ABC-2 type transport system permease protein
MHRFIPVLLRPKYLTLRNRWRGKTFTKRQMLRDLIIVGFAACVIVAIYLGTLGALQKIQSFVALAYLPPHIPLGLILLILSGMLVLSNGVATLGSLFLARDLELILASPLSRPRFFFGRMLDIGLSSSWMVLIFAAPMLSAFGVAYGASLRYYTLAVLTLIPFLFIPLALGMIAVSLFTAIIPASRTREVLFVVGILVIGVVHSFIEFIGSSVDILNDVQELLRVLALLTLPNKSWLPSFWMAHSLGEALAPTGKAVWPGVALLSTTAAGATAAAYLVVHYLHDGAFSRARSSSRGLSLKSRTAQTWLVRLTPFAQQPQRAILGKEYKVFTRDLSQALQLLLLLGLCLLYLYNFRILHAVKGLPEATLLWWRGFLVLSNLAMGAFVVSAVCTRFVFPSLSLEGQSWWVLQTAPLSVREILRFKFRCWLMPVIAISCVIFASGAFAIGAPPRTVLVTVATSCVISYGLVALAIGLGAVFANFDWEHPSQLAASFGSLVFMLCSTIVIALNVFPAMVLIFLRTLVSFGYAFTTLEWYAAVGSAAALLVYINFAVARAALRAGERALEAKLNGT